MKKYVGKIIIALFIVLFIAGCFIQAPITEAIGSLWSLLPPIIAIGLALITKEVYSSLFIGILTGGIVYAVATNGGFEGMFTTVIQDAGNWVPEWLAQKYGFAVIAPGGENSFWLDGLSTVLCGLFYDVVNF